MSLAETISQPLTDQRSTGRELTKKVLLLGNDDRVILAVARGLGREGISVHVAWSEPTSPALKSVHVSGSYAIPPYSPDSLDWLHSLNRLVQEQAFDLVIPCNDFALIPLQNARKSLDPDANWYLINDEAFRVAFDKAKTGHLAKSLGINTPREYALSSEQIRTASRDTEVNAIDEQQLKFPVFIKPHSSVTQADVKHKRSAQKIETPAELAAAFRESCPFDGLLIQESFVGEGIGVEVLASEGKVLMQLQHRRLRETIDGGSTYRETIAPVEELTAATHKLVKRLNYTGVAMFEFRSNPATRDWVLLEINARFWGSLPLAVAAGVNFPLGLYELLVNGRHDFESSYEVGKRCRNLVTDLRAWRKQKNSKLQLANLLLGRDHLDFFSRDDWRPLVANLSELASSLVAKVLKRRDGEL